MHFQVHQNSSERTTQWKTLTHEWQIKCLGIPMKKKQQQKNVIIEVKSANIQRL